MSEWPVRRVGDLVHQRKDVVVLQPGVGYRTMGVRWYGKGAYDRGAGTKETIKATKLWRAHAGDFVFNRIDTQNGPFDVVPPELDGALVTNEFPTYAGLPDVLDERFLLAYFQQQSVQDAIGLVRAGSEGRARWKEADFEAWTLKLPPLDEQRRIVAVMAAVDALVDALGRESEVARTALQRLITEAMLHLDARVEYGSLATTRSGPSWSADDESKNPVDGSTQVVKITNTKSDGSLDMADETYVAGLPSSTPTLDRHCLIIIRTNGNRGRIGNVYRATPDVYGRAVSAFQFISRAHDRANRDFLYWVLREPSMQLRMSEAASGSTGLGNLAVKWLNAAEVPWSDDASERAAVVERLDSAQSAVERLSSELAALRTVRSDLLFALLSQEIAVDVAVDEFVKAA